MQLHNFTDVRTAARVSRRGRSFSKTEPFFEDRLSRQAYPTLKDFVTRFFTTPFASVTATR